MPSGKKHSPKKLNPAITRDAEGVSQGETSKRKAIGAIVALAGLLILGTIARQWLGGSASSNSSSIQETQSQPSVLAITNQSSNGVTAIVESGFKIETKRDSSNISYEDFIGSQACMACHEEEFKTWSNSTHGLAGGKPDKVQVIAAFDGEPLEFRDALVRPVASGQGQFAFIVLQPGRPPFPIEVDAVVGGGHMHGGGTQSFFEEFPDGTLRFLPFDFIRKENQWFVQLRTNKHWVPISRDISLNEDLANWPPHRVLGSSLEYSNCQNCHGSQLNLQRDPLDNKLKTQFSSLTINCESCHGPAKKHVEWANLPEDKRSGDIGLASLATLNRDESLMVCFQCHALKDQLRDEPYLPGMDLNSHFSLKLHMFGDKPYFEDGRIASFGYQLNHLYSDCYRNGSMTCVDCHHPHSLTYRDAFGKPLKGKFDDGQCTSCHASKAVDPERHTHHKPGTPGSRCVDCHMPFLQHPGVGDKLEFARSDHSIPIPRPSFDHNLGIENACQKCHADQTLAWQDQKVADWYGELKPHPQAVGRLLHDSSTSNVVEAAKLLLSPGENHPMAQMAALVTFQQDFLHPGMKQWMPEIGQRLRLLTMEQDVDLQAFACMLLHVSFGEHPEAQSRVNEVLSGKDGQRMNVKRRWALAADRWGTQLLEGNQLDNAMICFQKSLEILPDNVVTLAHLAQAQEKAGDLDAAVTTQLKALALQPSRGTLHFQLARIYHQQQEVALAIRSLESGLKWSPGDMKAQAMLEYLKSLPDENRP